jgi:hypothetical protein
MPTTPTAEAAIDANCVRFLDRAEAIRDRHVVTAVLELGKAALDELYGGSWERTHDRAAAQDAPLAALMARFADRMGYLGLTVDRVRAALRAYDVDRQLPPATRGKLLPSQLRALAAVPGPSDRARLALQAAAERWTQAKVVEVVAAWREANMVKGKGGRPALPAAIKAARSAARSVGELGAGAVAALAPETKAAVVSELLTLRAQLDDVLEELGVAE